MASQPRSRIRQADKRTATFVIRVTQAEAQMLRRLMEVHDPPTVSGVVRDLLAERFDQPLQPRPPST